MRCAATPGQYPSAFALTAWTEALGVSKKCRVPDSFSAAASTKSFCVRPSTTTVLWAMVCIA